MALILALSMLTLLSILGAIVLTSSNTEVNISGNFRTTQESFYAAERAVEYAMGSETILKTASGEVDLNTDLDSDGDTHLSKLAQGGTNLLTSAENKVSVIGAGELPDSLRAIWGERWAGFYYALSVTGAGPGSRATSRVDAQQVRLWQKSDDSFRTSSGG
ncbi:pilus assembly PilX family protein [Desulfuromonas versatilis]|nr:pilus assembly PilX N-terminal domain-containing protein [Desulfuromonas versatilis]